MEEKKQQLEDHGNPSKRFTVSECQKHRLAHVMGQPVQDSEVCDCCYAPYEKSPVKCCFGRMDLEFYGEGACLYFEFIKLTIALMVVAVITCGIPNIALNITGEGCFLYTEHFKCSPTIFVTMSIANKLDSDYHDLNLQNYLINATVLAMFVVVQLWRTRFHHVEEQVLRIASPQQYAIMGSIPQLEEPRSELEGEIEEGIYEWFRQEQKLNYKELMEMQRQDEERKQRVEIEKIIISYDLHTAKQISDELASMKENIQVVTGNNYSEHSSRLDELVEEIQRIQIKRTNKFIAIFSFTKYAQYFSSVVNRNCLLAGIKYEHKFDLAGKEVGVMGAPMPSEILWENHHLNRRNKHLRRFLVYMMFLVGLFVGQGLIFVVLYYFWYLLVRPSNDTLEQYISGLISLFMVVVNFILYHFFILISDCESRGLCLEDQISKSIKIIFTVFLNEGILLFCAYYIIELPTMWVYNGFVDTLSYAFIFDIVFPHLVKYINLHNITKLYYYSRIHYTNPPYTQKMANTYYEKMEPLQPYHYYSWQITMFWLACFFASMVPMGLICICISFMLHFLLEHVNWVYVYKEHRPWGSKLNTIMVEFLEFGEFLLILGHLVTGIILRQTNQHPIDIRPLSLNIAIAVLLLCHIFFLPKNFLVRLVSCFYCKNQQRTNIRYSENKNKFLTTFQQERRVKYDGLNTNIDLADEKAVKEDLLAKVQTIREFICRQKQNKKRAERQETLIEIKQ